MTILVMTLIIVGGIAAFFLGAWFIGRLLIDHYEAAQLRLSEKRAAAYAKLADGIKAQFRSSVGALPGKLGKEAKGVIDDLVHGEAPNDMEG